MKEYNEAHRGEEIYFVLYDAQNRDHAHNWANKFGEVVPRGYKYIPQVVLEENNGNMVWIGGYEEFHNKYIVKRPRKKCGKM